MMMRTNSPPHDAIDRRTKSPSNDKIIHVFGGQVFSRNESTNVIACVESTNENIVVYCCATSSLSLTVLRSFIPVT